MNQHLFSSSVAWLWALSPTPVEWYCCCCYWLSWSWVKLQVSEVNMTLESGCTITAFVRETLTPSSSVLFPSWLRHTRATRQHGANWWNTRDAQFSRGRLHPGGMWSFACCIKWHWPCSLHRWRVEQTWPGLHKWVAVVIHLARALVRFLPPMT